MARLLYDTDVLIDHLQGTRALPLGDDLAYSSVSRAELYSWAAADEDRIDAFLDPLDEIVLDREVRSRRGVSVARPASSFPTPSSRPLHS